MKQSVVILGASGSIGRNSLSVIDNLNQNSAGKYQFLVKALVSNTNWPVMIEQISRFKPEFAVVNDPVSYNKVTSVLAKKHIRHTRLLSGNGAVESLVTAPDVDIVISSISGGDGFLPSLWAIKANKTIALANKESLVIAGDLLTSLRGFKKVIPVDSEHSGLFQILHDKYNTDNSQIRKIILTASGGPFHALPNLKLDRVTPEQALNHPTYQMGRKISIDSATLMNKAFEIIEAHHLFNLPAEKIEVVIHPQSIIHAMVEFTDGSVIAQMNQPDMKLPIQYALTYPNRINAGIKPLNFASANINGCKGLDLTFIKPDTKRFPALSLGYKVIRQGGTSGAVLNAANDEAVRLFLHKKISFTNITKLAVRILDQHKPQRLSLANIRSAEKWARSQVLELADKL